MTKSTVLPFESRAQGQDPLTEFIRSGARELIRQAVEEELARIFHDNPESL